MANLRIIALDAPADPDLKRAPVWLFGATSSGSYSDTVDDSVAGADAVAAALGIAIGVTDPITADDVSAAVLAAAASITDSVAGGDSVSVTVAFAASVTDGATGGDGATAGTSDTISDGATGADSATAALAAVASVSDAVTAADTASATVAISVSVSDGASATDAPAEGSGVSAVTDAVTAADAAATSAAFTGAVVEILDPGDAVTATGGALFIAQIPGRRSMREQAILALVSTLAATRADVMRDTDVPETIRPEGVIIVSEGEMTVEVMMSPTTYVCDLAAVLDVHVAGTDEHDRDERMDALLLTISDAIAADRTLGGVVEYAEPHPPEFEAYEAGAAAKAARMTVALSFSTEKSPLN